MYDAVVEINDIDFRISVGREVFSSPACALLRADGLHFGETAQAQARLYPLQVNNRFIQQLSLTQTPELAPYARHHADLAYRYLQFVHERSGRPERLVFLVPPGYNDQQLAVLLGVVAQCEFQAVGLLDQTVAVASQHASASSGVYCDLQWHELGIGVWQCAGEQLERVNSHVIEQGGLLGLYERWVRLIADAFIQQCRFDPLHDAAIEQQLWQQLPGELQAQADKDVFQFALLDKYQARIERADMLRPVQDLYLKLRERLENNGWADAPWLLSRRLTDLPGLTEMDERIVAASPDALLAAVAAHQQVVCSTASSLPFITRLPATRRESKTQQGLLAPAAAPATVKSATHFLLDGVARPLLDGVVYLRRSGGAGVLSATTDVQASCRLSIEDGGVVLQGLHGSNLWLNGAPFDSETGHLQRGDCVQLTPSGDTVVIIDVQAGSTAGETGDAS